MASFATVNCQCSTPGQPALFDPSIGAEDFSCGPDLLDYDRFVVAFSGGKDSLACLLHLIEECDRLGIPRNRIEAQHAEIDGREGNSVVKMDWPSTPNYCQKVCQALGIKLYFVWKTGGFEREMLRDNAETASTRWEDENGNIQENGGNSGKLGTRLKFPQTSADLSVRWCSSYLKIDPCLMAIRHSARFQRSKTLVLSGERSAESPGRAKYATFEADKSDRRHGANKRHVDRWRPVHAWDEESVWDIIKRHGIVPSPAYRIGWGRLSCACCIFGSNSMWATLEVIAPATFEAVAKLEDRFGVTIDRKGQGIRERAKQGIPFPAAMSNPEVVEEAMDPEWDGNVLVDPSEWVMPAGAFGENAGPI